jgi:hypothetical protein
VPEIVTLVAGIVCLLSALGVGTLLLRLIPVAAPLYWHLSLALLFGTGIAELFLTSALYLGGGVRTIQLVSAFLLVLGTIFIFRQLIQYRSRPFVIATGRDRWLWAVVVTALAINLLIALAPSTKIDELHYHMLVPKRVIQDNGLRPYRQPFEAAIFPQFAFQYSLSAVHAFGVPEAGNVISWGMSVSLVFLIIGVVAELTAKRQAGLLFGAVAAVGLYPAVWHVTSGPHALGDLATMTAFSLFLLPEEAVAWAPLKQRLGLICAAAAMAASTKISLLPIAIALSLLAWHKTARRTGWKISTLLLAGVWTVILGPALAWSFIRSGSPFGIVTAAFFHSNFFDASSMAALAYARQERTTGLLAVFTVMAPSLSIGFLLALAIIVGNARKRPSFRIVLCFVAAQIVLIALFLPHDFRFLGGLQFFVLTLAGWALTLSPQGQLWLGRSRLLVFPLCLPWLAIQLFYAAKFLSVDIGMESRQAFLHRYVAFSEDFHRLDLILPRDAILYITNSPKNPSYYAPRPVIYTLGDATPGQHIYRFSVGSAEPDATLVCHGTVYENPHAVIYAYRTSEPIYDTLLVQKCF